MICIIINKTIFSKYSNSSRRQSSYITPTRRRILVAVAILRSRKYITMVVLI